jgi:hypothetical protein
VPTETILERPLPNNLDAERSVLGAVLLDNNALNTAIENLRPEDFFLDQHRRVFLQMIALSESQQAIDLITLTEALHIRGELESAGGAPYLASLADGMPRVSNVEHYARMALTPFSTMRNPRSSPSPKIASKPASFLSKTSSATISSASKKSFAKGKASLVFPPVTPSSTSSLQACSPPSC